jgi:hypothetical protein
VIITQLVALWFVILNKYNCGVKTEQVEMGRACGMCTEVGEYIQGSGMEIHMWERAHKEDLSVDGRKYNQNFKESEESSRNKVSLPGLD